MSPDQAFTDLMARLRTGDQRAAAKVFNTYANRLIALAQSKIGGAFQTKVDPEDVTQSAFRSFFRRYSHGQFDLTNWDSLWSILVVFTLRKCGHQIEHFKAARRDVGREVGSLASANDSTVGNWEAIAREPTPTEAAQLAETVEQLLSYLSERDRPILELSLEGYTPAEVSLQLGRAERSVYRVLERVKAKLESLRAGADDTAVPTTPD